MNKTKTFNHNEAEYTHFLNVLTDAIRNCPEIRGVSILTGDTIMLTPFHQLSIEQNDVNNWKSNKSITYRVMLNRIVDGGFEYLVVDDGTNRNHRTEAVEEALDKFYEELAFHAPEENTTDTMDISLTLEGLFHKYTSFINSSYSSSFA